jgi:hypothetical protein
MWQKLGVIDVIETPLVIDCEYLSFADYWGVFTGGMAIISSRLMALPESERAEIEKHVRNGYLLDHPDGPRSFPMVFRIVRGRVSANI